MPGYFSVTPASVRYDDRLTLLGIILYGEVTALSNKRGYCSASNQYFANLYKKDPKWISKVLNQLAQAGHIHIDLNTEDNITVRRMYPITQHLPIVENMGGVVEKEEGGSSKTSPGGRRKLHPNNTRNNTTRNNTTASDSFAEFWAIYPRKVSKQSALKAWSKIEITPTLLEEILNSVRAHSSTPQWTKDGGQFIPHPATFINGRRWEDEVKSTPAKAHAGKYDNL